MKKAIVALVMVSGVAAVTFAALDSSSASTKKAVEKKVEKKEKKKQCKRTCYFS